MSDNTSINPWSNETPEFPRLMGELGFLTAAKKQVSNLLNAKRAEAETEFRGMAAYTGMNRADIKIGEAKVGSVTITKPSVKVTNDELFGEIASDCIFEGFPAAIRHATFHVPDCSEALEEEIQDAIEAIVGHAIDTEYEWKTSKAFLDSLKSIGGNVVAPDGSVIPGAVFTAGTMRVTGCKPEDVAEAINLAQLDAPSVAQMLEADDE